jgi:glycosyltransferase involved in cell wall biosynthesis
MYRLTDAAGPCARLRVGKFKLKTRRRGRGYDVAFYVPRITPLLVPEARSPTGGAETQVLLLAQELSRRGLGVRLVVFELPGVEIPAALGDVSVFVRPCYRTRERFGRIREVLTIAWTITRIDADVVVCRAVTPEVGIAGLVAKVAGGRFVYSSANVSDFRDDAPEPGRRVRRRVSAGGRSSSFDFSRYPRKRLDWALFRLGLRVADTIVVQTEEQARLCLRLFGRGSAVIKSIAETAPLRTQSPQAFLWIGRLVGYKRPDAYVELARAVPEARFWMIAPLEENPDVALAAAVEEAASTTPNLELLAARPRHEVLELIDRAVAVVNTADFEGMPNIFLEGWSRGVPALALTHDPDGVIEQFRLGGFAHGSPDRLIELASRLWEDRHDQRDLAVRCRAYVDQHHSPETIGARWHQLLTLTGRKQAETGLRS